MNQTVFLNWSAISDWVYPNLTWLVPIVIAILGYIMRPIILHRLKEHRKDLKEEFENMKGGVFKPWYKDFYNQRPMGVEHHPVVGISVLKLDTYYRINENQLNHAKEKWPYVFDLYEHIYTEYEEYVTHCNEFVESVFEEVNKIVVEEIWPNCAYWVYAKALGLDTHLDENIRSLSPQTIDIQSPYFELSFGAFGIAKGSKEEIEECMILLDRLSQTEEHVESSRELNEEAKKLKHILDKFRRDILGEVVNSVRVPKRKFGKAQYKEYKRIGNF